MWLKLGSKGRSFDRDIKSKIKIVLLGVDSACDAYTTLNVVLKQHA